jgi:hypothetical protein
MKKNEPMGAKDIDKDFWQQGDCFIEDAEKFYKVSTEGQVIFDNNESESTDEVLGFCIVTQTCDLTREASLRPYIQVCPIIAVDKAILASIEKFERPNFAAIPNLKSDSLVADLDRIMTIEKTYLSKVKKIKGCLSDTDSKNFAEALSRKFSRHAFPDDFNILANPLSNI